jgi:phage shock protein A
MGKSQTLTNLKTYKNFKDTRKNLASETKNLDGNKITNNRAKQQIIAKTKQAENANSHAKNVNTGYSAWSSRWRHVGCAENGNGPQFVCRH